MAADNTANVVVPIGTLPSNLDKEFEDNGQAEFDREESEEALAEVSQLMLVSNPENNNTPCEHKSRGFRVFGYLPSEIKWTNVIWLLCLHLAFPAMFAIIVVNPVKFYSVVWTVLLSVFSGFGMSVGAHRYWAHRSFQATWLLRLFLIILQTMTINGSAFSYARDHRNHHKWPATHADPKNPNRGFWYAHIFWWTLKKRPEVAFYGGKVPIQDLLEDNLLMLQHRFYIPLVIVLAFIVPIAIPVVAWNESVLTSTALCIVRIVVVLHHLFTVNSVAHFWGQRPYDRFIKPAENRIINWITYGEGEHNMHHTFPFDSRNSGFDFWEVFNPASLFIHCCQVLRLASHPKKASKQLVAKVVQSKGKPEFFVHIHQRSLGMRIVLGVLDWIAGLFLAQWPAWLGMLLKAALGYQIFVF